MKRLIITALFIIMLILASTLPHAYTYTTTSNTINTGKAIISVFDKQYNSPILNATICVLETREYYQTNKLGSSIISLPTKATNKLKYSSPEKNWTEYTLLIYKNGYYPHILYGLQIEHNITTSGIVIELEELSEYTSHNHTQSYYYPNDAWVENVIKEYKK